MRPRSPAIAAALLATAAATAAPAHAQETDPWFGRDKALHFAVSGSIAVAGYAGASLVTENRPARAGVAASLALGAGVAKELWDLGGHGDASWRDLTWDVIGTATGVLIAETIDWLLQRTRSRVPQSDDRPDDHPDDHPGDPRR